MRGVPTTISIASGSSAEKVLLTAGTGGTVVFVEGITITPNGTTGSVGYLIRKQGATEIVLLAVRTPADRSVIYDIPTTLVIPEGWSLVFRITGGVGAYGTVVMTV